MAPARAAARKIIVSRIGAPMRRRSAAAKFGRIIIGRRVVVVGPQTARNGVVAIDPHTTRGDIAWDLSLAGTNDDAAWSGVMPSCGGVR